MGAANKTLGELLDYVDSGRLVLPEIQRDFVWKKTDVRYLFDSLFRGLPIGYMLVWRAQRLVASKPLARPKRLKVGDVIDNFYGYLLDGQQRLTAIKLVRDGDNGFPLNFSLWPEDIDRPEKDRFSFVRHRSDNPWFIPVSEVLSPDFNVYKVVDRLRKLDELDDEGATYVHGWLSQLTAILKYDIGIIEFEDDDYDKATELFIRFNSTGRKLGRNDLAAAELALKVPELVSEGVARLATVYFPRFTFTRTFLIQCLAAVHKGRINFKKSEEIWDGGDPKAIRRSWKKTERGVNQVVKFLTGTVRWDSEAWLPSINSIIPLVYLFAHEKLTAADRANARRWLLQSNLVRVFSGSVHSEIDRQLRGLRKDRSIDKLLNLTKKAGSKVKPLHFDTKRKSGPAMSLYISMLRNMNAVDWDRGIPLDGTVVGHNAALQIHHFFPQALLSEHGFGRDEINTFANYTVISKGTNLDISADEPADYVKRLRIRKAELKKQCIPLDRNLWKVERYRDFLRSRRKLLAQRANGFLAK